MLPFLHLDTLWLQISGTRCNIACRHCLVNAGPQVNRHQLLKKEEVKAWVLQAEDLGVRGIWLTGGEPFLHPDILEITAFCLEKASVGILTNGMLITQDTALSLKKMFDQALYSLEIRVSLDGLDAASNDRLRGIGVFNATCEGIRQLAAVGLEPILAVTLVKDGALPERSQFIALLKALGLSRPRVKWIPAFPLGREAKRHPSASLALNREQWEDPEAPLRLQCGTSRTITSQGVFPCPILIEEKSYILSQSLAESLRPHPVDHPACTICWEESFSCS